MSEDIEVGPGTGRALFKEMQAHGLIYERMTEEELHDWFQSDYEQVQEVAEALRMASPYQWKPLESPFSFLVSSSLSGAGNPSFGIESRLQRAGRLARFAALYADTVLIPDPFEGVLYGETSKRDLVEFFHTLAVLQTLQSEIEAGIVRFAPRTSRFARKVWKNFAESRIRIGADCLQLMILLPGMSLKT
jgi:hypothetical protein